jgi:hypothetical protein
MSENTVLKTFIRDSNNNPTGVAVVVNQDGKFGFGYSLVNPDSSDRFDRKIGTAIAVNRAKFALGESRSEEKPDLESRKKPILEAYDALEKRAVKYFK